MPPPVINLHHLHIRAMASHWTRPAVALLTLAAILALTWLAYHAGLAGDFLFDDFGNLPAIGATGPVTHWATFWRYITSGTADPTGRPLTLLTFLIDARDWPANPYPFKVTNVILHLVNGALLAWVLWRLGQVLVGTEPEVAVGRDAPHAPRDDAGRRSTIAAVAALFGAGAWLLHPLLVSTTLYIVQREAMLPATFVLLGILGWIGARRALVQGHTRRAVAGFVLSAWLCTGLAVLSKANGALLPLLLLLIEWIVLSRQPVIDAAVRRRLRQAVGVFLALPAVLVSAYLVYLLPGAIRATPGIRGWTTGERLLTQARVVTDYLHLLVVPRPYSTGLFNDAFTVSTGWLHPASTLACVVLLAALIAAGFVLRKRHPAIALALLFYFAAQLMESTWIPLELYYEHRNYLPAMLLFWPLGFGLLRFKGLRWLGALAAACILLLLAGMTWQRSILWGDGMRQAQVWAAINPGSARAQTNAALYDLAHDRPRLAVARLELSLPKHPGDIQAPINLVGAQCRLGDVPRSTLETVNAALESTRLGGGTAFKWFDEALGLASRHACTGLGFAELQAALDAARSNPHWRASPGRQQDLHHLQGQLDLAEGKPDAALAEFKQALAISPEPGAALEQAAYFGARGYPQLGLAELDYFETLPPGPKPGRGMRTIHAWVLHLEDWWPKETAYLRQNLEQDAAAKHATKPAKP